MVRNYPYSAGGSGADVIVAPGACDCHIHVYDRRFGVAKGATLNPPDADADDYRQVQQRLGLSRVVLVTPSTYGTDNRCMLAGLARLGDAARGVAVIAGDESDEELQRLHAAGVRGVRINLSMPGPHTTRSIAPIADRIAPLGWHLQLLMPVDQLAALAPTLTSLPVDIVFDHFARIPSRGFNATDAYQLVCSMVEKRRAWVKLSGAYLMSTQLTEFDALATTLIHSAPDRMVWGSNWPHPTAMAGIHPLPDDAQQLETLARWADSDTTLQNILVTNPSRLYGFTSRHDQ